MAARLPTVGGDSGSWGTILNTYLSVEHNADGTFKRDPATSSQTGLVQLATQAQVTTGTDAGKVITPSTLQGKLFSTQALTDGATISWDVSQGTFATVTLGGNRTLSNPTNLVTGSSYVLVVTQDGTGGRTLAYGNKFKFAGGIVPTLSLAASAIDIISFLYDGTNLYGSFAGAFA